MFADESVSETVHGFVATLVQKVLQLVLSIDPDALQADGRLRTTGRLIHSNAGPLGLAAGPDPRAEDNLAVAVALEQPEREIVFVASVEPTGKVDLRCFEDGPWVAELVTLGGTACGPDQRTVH